MRHCGTCGCACIQTSSPCSKKNSPPGTVETRRAARPLFLSSQRCLCAGSARPRCRAFAACRQRPFPLVFARRIGVEKSAIRCPSRVRFCTKKVLHVSSSSFAHKIFTSQFRALIHAGFCAGTVSAQTEAAKKTRRNRLFQTSPFIHRKSLILFLLPPFSPYSPKPKNLSVTLYRM